jgi:deoxycytidylate deaminase
VLHAGYEAFLDRHPGADEILLIGASFADDFKVIRKEIRALDPARAAAYLNAAGTRPPARVIEREDLPKAVTGDTLVLPDEDLTRDLVQRYALANATFERTFLRWDRSWSQAGRPADFDGTVSTDELVRALLGTAITDAARSSDWWRQVGALAARGAEVLYVAHNEHQPTEYAPYLNGDPRNDFSRGVRMDLSTALHAEAAIIGRAARAGVPLEGADLYVSTFPCPSCARLVAAAGFRRCYFAGPYAVLDGDEVLRQAGVELIWVDLG